MTDEIPMATDRTVSQPYRIGDPVVDLAQGRSMVVLDAPTQTVAEWSDANNYDLQDNYANSKFDPEPTEAVVECVYTSDIRSEPSKTYTFPVSRVALIDAHHADDGRRVADRVTVEFIESLFSVAIADGPEGTLPEPSDVAALLLAAGVDGELIDAGDELAKATHGAEEYAAADE